MVQLFPESVAQINQNIYNDKWRIKKLSKNNVMIIRKLYCLIVIALMFFGCSQNKTQNTGVVLLWAIESERYPITLIEIDTIQSDDFYKIYLYGDHLISKSLVLELIKKESYTLTLPRGNKVDFKIDNFKVYCNGGYRTISVISTHFVTYYFCIESGIFFIKGHGKNRTYLLREIKGKQVIDNTELIINMLESKDFYL